MNWHDILKHCCPFPFAVSGMLHDGVVYRQLNICRKCSEKTCCRFSAGELIHQHCAKGFSCYPLTINGQDFVLNGLIAAEFNEKLVGKKRKPYRPNVVTHANVAEFYNHLRDMREVVLRETSKEVRGSVAFLHDIRTSVGIVLSCCQDVIGQTSGRTFEDKLRDAPDSLLGLYHSINLLTEQLQLADVIPNPSRITYGPKSVSSINGFLFKMCKIWEPRFRLKKHKIEIRGFTKARIEAYNSIQFIPLILLDNALKYSAPNSTTYITLQEYRVRNLVEVCVSSFGRVVSQEFQERIFEKFVRGPNAEELNSQGTGLGLYLAQEIAKAHGFVIEYRAASQDGLSGNNQFSFQMPICGYEP